MESIVKILYLNVFDGDELGLICCSCEILRYNISSDINIYGSETGQILDNYVNTMTVDALAHCVTRTSAAMGLNMQIYTDLGLWRQTTFIDSEMMWIYFVHYQFDSARKGWTVPKESTCIPL